jgi:hypothetical protein
MGYATKTAMRRWHVKRQIASAERRLADLRAELVTLGEPSRRGSKRPVACGDRWFPSLSAAAGAEGVTDGAIWQRIQRGADGWRYAEPSDHRDGEFARENVCPASAPCDHCGEEFVHEDGCPAAEVAGQPVGEART